LGTHSDVGGGNKEEQGLANLSLVWIISQLSGVLAFDNAAIRDITQTATALDKTQRVTGHRCRIRQGRQSTGVFEINISVPVDRFQARTGVQVGGLAKLQRVSGWSFREPFSCDENTNESLHWSVDVLLDKHIVAACKPLENARITNTPQAISHTQRNELERGVLATWIVHDILALMQMSADFEDLFIDAQGLRKENSSSLLTRPSLAARSVSSKFLPFYPVLQDPDAWKTAEGYRDDKISVSAQGAIEFVDTEILQSRYGTSTHAETTSAATDAAQGILCTLQNVSNSLNSNSGLTFHLGCLTMKRNRRMPVLSGSVEIPYQASLDPSRETCTFSENVVVPQVQRTSTL
jgi:hypothetical protein